MGGGAQNPLTQMVTNPVTGQTQTVRQAMTSDDAYRGVDTTPDYSNVTNVGNPFGYGMQQTGPGSSNPRAPGQDVATNV